MKLKESFITHDTNGEQVMIDVAGGFNGLVRSNGTAAFIVELLKTEQTEDSIVEKMLETYDAPETVIQKDVKDIIAKLKQIGAIEG